jgi:hypothetical protein
MAKFVDRGYFIKEKDEENLMFFLGSKDQVIDYIKTLNTTFVGSEYYINGNSIAYYIPDHLNIVWKIE